MTDQELEQRLRTALDVAAYLKKQKKEAEEPVNNAFAAALKGIKL